MRYSCRGTGVKLRTTIAYSAPHPALIADHRIARVVAVDPLQNRADRSRAANAGSSRYKRFNARDQVANAAMRSEVELLPVAAHRS